MSETLYAFILFVVVATVTPGGATALATASGARFGYRRSLPLLLGIATGLAILAAAAAFGLAALLQSMPALALAMKLVGSSYLLWLAYRVGSTGAPAAGGVEDATPISFPCGLLLLMVNPKGWAMAFAAAASFAALAASPADLAVIMAASFGLIAIGSMSLWCVGGMVLARNLRSERQWRILNLLLGAMLAASVVPIWLN